MHSYIQYSTPTSFRSKFNPLVALNPDFINKFNNDFLYPKFVKMCNELGILQERFVYLPIEDLITEKEFEKIDMELAKPYFYEKLFADISKNEKGRIENKIRFTFTYDKDLATVKRGNVNYGVISLGNKPVFYYCYIDLQEVIKFIKELE